MSDKWVSEAVKLINYALKEGGFFMSDADTNAEAKEVQKLRRHAKRVLLACGNLKIDEPAQTVDLDALSKLIHEIKAARAEEEKRK